MEKLLGTATTQSHSLRKLPRHFWHLGCILSKPASNIVAGRLGDRAGEGLAGFDRRAGPAERLCERCDQADQQQVSTNACARLVSRGCVFTPVALGWVCSWRSCWGLALLVSEGSGGTCTQLAVTPDGTLHLVPNHGVKWLTACPSASDLDAVDGVDGVRSVQLSEDTLQAGLELEVWLDRSVVEVYVNGGSDILVAVSTTACQTTACQTILTSCVSRCVDRRRGSRATPSCRRQHGPTAALRWTSRSPWRPSRARCTKAIRARGTRRLAML